MRKQRLRPRSLIALIVVVGALSLTVLWLGQDMERASTQDNGLYAETAGPAERQTVHRYDIEYPIIRYSASQTSDPIAQLQQRLARGETRLRFDPVRGYLDSVLEALDIDAASQLLVFSATSLQGARIQPETPRAIYFDDDTYVAWVQDTNVLEIASMDPNLGPVFYLLEQVDDRDTHFDRQINRCLRCHDSYSLTGDGVPRFIVGSGYIGTQGNLVSHEGWILTNDETPLRSRWGGWYVTGERGTEVHLGNLIVEDPAELQRLDELRVGNVDDLELLFDTSPYLTTKSDVVALLVFEHQTHIQNLITRVGYDTRTMLASQGPGAETSAETRDFIQAATEPLVRALFFSDEAELVTSMTGNSGFSAEFASRGPRDTRGRSLRDFDLTQRLFRYPLSYVVYSNAYDALPDPAKAYLSRRFAEVLTGRDQSEEFSHLSETDRTAILEILSDTKPGFAAALSSDSL